MANLIPVAIPGGNLAPVAPESKPSATVEREANHG